MKPPGEVAVDELVRRIAPRVALPAVRRVDAVLVTGPWLAGVSAVAGALNAQLPERTFVESDQLAAGEAPAAVVFVVSAAAVMTRSDYALIDSAAANTDAIIGAVSKIDRHRQWRHVLAVNQETLARYAVRYREVAWVGVAAAPEQGEPRVGELVTAITEQLANPDLARRNRLRAWEARLQAVADSCDRDADGAGRQLRVAALREQRSMAVQQRRLLKAERTIALRSQTQQARVQLSYFARNRCASLRSELQEDAAELTRRRLPSFESDVRDRVGEVMAEVDDGCAKHLSDMAHGLGLPSHSEPFSAPEPIGYPGLSLRARRLETRLMMLLGAGFGLGVTLTLTRLLADVTEGLTVAGIVACVATGLALAVWVVGTRGLLHDRAVIDRWVVEVTGSLRTAAEHLVATRVLAAESTLTRALREQDEADTARLADQIGAIDAELREHAIADARAAALRDQQAPTLHRALQEVRAELGDRVSEPQAR